MLMDLPWWAAALVFIGMFTLGPIVAWLALCLAANLFGLSFLWNRGRENNETLLPLKDEEMTAIRKYLGIDKEDND